MIDVILPHPPSANRLKKPGVINDQLAMVLTKGYQSWKQHAGYLLNGQHAKPIKGRYHLVIMAARGIEADLGNLEKATSDLLQRHRLIDNDRLAESIFSYWVDPERVGWPGEGNLRVQAYPANGGWHPDDRDQQLPVPAGDR